MKNILSNFIGSLLLILLCSSVHAQNSKVVSAYNYMKYEEYDKAYKTICEALTDAETAQKPKGWVYKGQILYKIATSKEDKYKNIVPNALDSSAFAFFKAMSLDPKQNYMQEMAMYLMNFGVLYSNQGIEYYNKKDYANALTSFEKAYQINTQMNGGKSDTLNLTNAAVSAELSKNYDKSIDLFTKLTSDKLGGASAFRSLADAYKGKGNEAKQIETLKAGRTAYPNDGNLIFAELDIYLQKGQDKEALDNLNLAIQKDPKNAVLFGVLANIHDRLNNLPLAEENYKKALELDPKYFDAAYNLGALYFNKGVNLTNDANALPLSAKDKYKKLTEEADKAFTASVPYLEKAMEINPTDKNTLISLKQLYLNMGQTEKAKQMDAKLNALK